MGALKPRSSLLFSLTTDPAHCEPARRHYTGSKLRRLVGVARGPIGSQARLLADWTDWFQSGPAPKGARRYAYELTQTYTFNQSMRPVSNEKKVNCAVSHALSNLFFNRNNGNCFSSMCSVVCH